MQISNAKFATRIETETGQMWQKCAEIMRQKKQKHYKKQCDIMLN
jgi:hypothetical protein